MIAVAAGLLGLAVIAAITGTWSVAALLALGAIGVAAGELGR